MGGKRIIERHPRRNIPGWMVARRVETARRERIDVTLRLSRDVGIAGEDGIDVASVSIYFID
jgi:hypothetical protein